MPGTYSQLLLHIVTSTKGRTPWISTTVAERLYPYIGGTPSIDRRVHAVSSAPPGRIRLRTDFPHGFRCASPAATVHRPLRGQNAHLCQTLLKDCTLASWRPSGRWPGFAVGPIGRPDACILPIAAQGFCGPCEPLPIGKKLKWQSLSQGTTVRCSCDPH
jgi:hypothetical protein